MKKGRAVSEIAPYRTQISCRWSDVKQASLDSSRTATLNDPG